MAMGNIAKIQLSNDKSRNEGMKERLSRSVNMSNEN